MKRAKSRIPKGPKNTSALSFSEQSVEVVIERIAMGGAGLGHIQGKVIFVPFTHPGDRVLTKITEDHERYYRGEAIEWLELSSERIDPKCPYFYRCGGCDWQHIPYNRQLQIKSELLMEQMRHLNLSHAEVLPILPSPKQFQYRNRAQLQFDGDDIGYFSKGSHNLVPIDHCDLLEEPLNKAILELKEKSNNLDKGRLEIFNLNEAGPFSLRAPAVGDFSQVNRLQNENLKLVVVDWALDGSEDQLFDLYSGAGNFYFPLIKAKRWLHAWACELGVEATQRAQSRIQAQNLSPKYYSYLCADVKDFVRRQNFKPGSLVVLDPPRSGCDEAVIRALANAPLSRVLYVSCNPSTLQRDLKRFLDLNQSARIRRVLPIDMFPQTAHIEALVEVVIDTDPSDASL